MSFFAGEKYKVSIATIDISVLARGATPQKASECKLRSVQGEVGAEPSHSLHVAVVPVLAGLRKPRSSGQGPDSVAGENVDEQTVRFCLHADGGVSRLPDFVGSLYPC